MLSILKDHACREAFKRWDNPDWEYFLSDIWLKTDWTRNYYIGVLAGATYMSHVSWMGLAEAECLLHAFSSANENKLT
jgi:hypothetical protein